VLVALCGSAAALPAGFSYPPDGVILLQHSTQVELRGHFPKGIYRAELWRAETLVQRQTLQGSSWTVTADPGKEYLWKVYDSKGIHQEGRFQVAAEFRFSADGANGRPGTKGITSQEGGAGEPGAQIDAELRRYPDGMHLTLRTRKQRRHYLFVEPKLRLAVSSRGGNGGAGADGLAWHGYNPSKGRKGGDAGWGGNLIITTHDAPWRDYLEVDLRPGEPGPGGKGAAWAPSPEHGYGPDGPHGNFGGGGRVVTKID